MSLPVCAGGLGIINPSEIAPMEFRNSKSVSAPLVANIVAQNDTYDSDQDKVEEMKKEIRAKK